MTERVKGLTLEQAGMIKNTEIAKELCLPPVKLHCSSKPTCPGSATIGGKPANAALQPRLAVLAEDAITAAIKVSPPCRLLHVCSLVADQPLSLMQDYRRKQLGAAAASAPAASAQASATV